MMMMMMLMTACTCEPDGAFTAVGVDEVNTRGVIETRRLRGVNQQRTLINVHLTHATCSQHAHSPTDNCVHEAMKSNNEQV